MSSPPRALTVRLSLVASAPVMFTRACRPATVILDPSRVDRIWTVSAPSVPLTTTESTWPSPPPAEPVEVQVDRGDVGSGQVVDGDGVGAAQGVEVDRLDAGEVHRDVADVAGEPDAIAVGRDTEILRVVRAVEDHPVGAALSR